MKVAGQGYSCIYMGEFESHANVLLWRLWESSVLVGDTDYLKKKN